jgi:hypothetical protein
MTSNTLFKIRFNIVLVSGDILSDFTTTVVYKFLLFQLSGQLSRYPGGARVFFFCKTFGPAFGPTQLPTQWIPG